MQRASDRLSIFPNEVEDFVTLTTAPALRMTAARATDADTNRRKEVLEAALELLADHGYAGASLRKVAARVGIAQPSLYHYFKTKEELVEHVVGQYAGQMFSVVDPDALPRTLEDVPRFIVDMASRLYELPSHRNFVLVAFGVSRVNPRFNELMRRIFLEQASLGMRMVMQPFIAAGQIDEEPAVHLVRMLINGIGLRLIEEKVLFGDDHTSEDTARFEEFVIEAGEHLVRAYRNAQ